MVMVFFVLSGFFIHLRSSQDLAGGRQVRLDTREFYKRRIHRLLAPYLFALLITLVCDLVGREWFPRLYSANTGDPLLDQNFAKKGYGLESVLPALVLLPSSFGKDFGSNGPLWSLAYEIIFYALYPGWLALRRQSPTLAFCLVPIACSAIAFIPTQSFALSVLLHYPIWLAGAALAEVLQRIKPAKSLIGAAALLFCAAILLHLAIHHPLLKLLGAVVLGTSAVCAFAALPTEFCGNIFAKAAEYFGIRSYTIYIVHFPLVALLSACVIEVGGARPLNGWVALVGGALVLAFGCLCFSACERHFLHRRPQGQTLSA